MNDEILVAHAGSLGALVEKDLVPGFTGSTGCKVVRQAGPAVGLANLILNGSLAPDVYMSADGETNRLLMGDEGGNKVHWYLAFARTRMVLAYSPQSRFLPEFTAAANGELPWFEVLQRPGLVFLRSDPRVDPGGYRALFVFQLAEQFYGRQGLNQQILQGDENEVQLLAGRPNLHDGSVDAVMMYVTSAANYGLPYIQLPAEIDLSSQALADWYRTASYTNPRGQRFYGTPATYSVTIPQAAANPADAARFVAYLFSEAGRRALEHHGFIPTTALPGGDRTAVPAELRSLLVQD
ncbi:MAG: extracellular solute-binding protein [Caldilineaceae bacterium]